MRRGVGWRRRKREGVWGGQQLLQGGGTGSSSSALQGVGGGGVPRLPARGKSLLDISMQGSRPRPLPGQYTARGGRRVAPLPAAGSSRKPQQAAARHLGAPSAANLGTQPSPAQPSPAQPSPAPGAIGAEPNTRPTAPAPFSHPPAPAPLPSLPASAFLQSIMPAPVFSRSCFTAPADTATAGLASAAGASSLGTSSCLAFFFSASACIVGCHSVGSGPSVYSTLAQGVKGCPLLQGLGPPYVYIFLGRFRGGNQARGHKPGPHAQQQSGSAERGVKTCQPQASRSQSERGRLRLRLRLHRTCMALVCASTSAARSATDLVMPSPRLNLRAARQPGSLRVAFQLALVRLSGSWSRVPRRPPPGLGLFLCLPLPLGSAAHLAAAHPTTHALRPHCPHQQ